MHMMLKWLPVRNFFDEIGNTQAPGALKRRLVVRTLLMCSEGYRG
jgi:hypothetical protein